MADVKVFPPMSEREIKGAEICAVQRRKEWSC